MIGGFILARGALGDLVPAKSWVSGRRGVCLPDLLPERRRVPKNVAKKPARGIARGQIWLLC
jgi:hypothetical protein